MYGVTNRECFCQHDIHRVLNYLRKDLKVKPKIPKGMKVEIIGEWSNLYGTYYRVVFNELQYDIKKSDMTLI